MHRFISILMIAGFFLCACATQDTAPVAGGGEDAIDAGADNEALEEQAYEITGDVRVYYYVKEMMIDSAHKKGNMIEQKEMRHTLINKSHSFYLGMPDHEMAREERLLYNSDMYDLLKIFKELRFFDRGNSVNILGDDPIARADSEPNTMRIIAVEVIKDDKVNTSYFARRIGENTVDKGSAAYERSTAFNECQAVLMQAVAGALPRGNVGYGPGDTDGLGRD